MPVSPASGFPGVLKAEVDEIKARRKALFPKQKPLPAGTGTGDCAEAHRLRAFGVAFSGGGIRSATFNLGVLQGLAEVELLPFVDYLSTVSGGGYIGSWLHGVIRNRHAGNPLPAQEELKPARVPGEAGEDPIAFLRKYSNYLAPQVGLFSPDFWTIASVWLRNMVLNLLILVPFLLGVVLTVLMAGFLNLNLSEDLRWAVERYLWAPALLFAVFVIGANLRRIVVAQFPEQKAKVELPDLSGHGWVTAATACIGFASYMLGAFRHDPAVVEPRIVLAVLGVLFFLFQWLGGFPVCHAARHEGDGGLGWMIGIPVVCSLATTALLWCVWRWTWVWMEPDTVWQRIAVGPALVLLVWMSGTTLQIGLMGSDFPDAAREWLARFGATVSIIMTAWVGLFVLAVFGPYWIAAATLRWAPAGVALAGGWIVSGAGGYLAGKSGKTKGGAEEEGSDTSPLGLVAKVAPVVFLAGFLLFLSLGTHLLLRALADPADCATPVTKGIPGWLLWLEPVRREYWYFLYYFTLEGVLKACGVAMAVCAAIVALLPLRININEFSMHHFYKNRLVRCYLGASRAKREPNRLTGFDPHDDFPVAALKARETDPQYRGPYPLVNCALNLNTGSELATQERRGASFLFTPRYCGFDPPHSKEDLEDTARIAELSADGYRPTLGYMAPSGPMMGTAVAISGAAANPNMGYHTSAPLAFLMTILNARLGWWLGNPRREGPSQRPGPVNALVSLLSELFAQSNGRSRYVNASDGGHFENLGLYELVRRRCRYIIVGDAEADTGLNFDGLGGAIRKCRADFGVEITLNPDPIRLRNGRSRAHCVVGSIVYPEAELGFAADTCGRDLKGTGRATGWLLYLKSSLTGDEPEDVQQYRATHGAFPHESTADQFFSESQFESYRQLGLHVVRTAFENVSTRPSALDEAKMLGMFQDLCRKWYPAPSFPEDKVNTLTEQYSEFMRRIGEDKELAFLDSQLFAGLPPVAQPKETPRKAVYFCMELIQFMEDVYFELNFEHKGDRENPVFTGWDQVFRAWANAPAVLDAWKVAGEGFNPLFREYFEGLRKGAGTP